jgi:plastocyanin
VLWTNKDDIPHTVTSDTNVFSSPVLDTNQNFRFEFATPGNFAYFCKLHPKMTGKVVVQ